MPPKSAAQRREASPGLRSGKRDASPAPAKRVPSLGPGSRPGVDGSDTRQKNSSVLRNESPRPDRNASPRPGAHAGQAGGSVSRQGSGQCPCPNCGRTFMSADRLEVHLKSCKTAVAEREPCPTCSRTFAPEKLAAHMKNCRPVKASDSVWASQGSRKTIGMSISSSTATEMIGAGDDDEWDIKSDDSDTLNAANARRSRCAIGPGRRGSIERMRDVLDPESTGTISQSMFEMTLMLFSERIDENGASAMWDELITRGLAVDNVMPWASFVDLLNDPEELSVSDDSLLLFLIHIDKFEAAVRSGGSPSARDMNPAWPDGRAPAKASVTKSRPPLSPPRSKSGPVKRAEDTVDRAPVSKPKAAARASSPPNRGAAAVTKAAASRGSDDGAHGENRTPAKAKARPPKASPPRKPLAQQMMDKQGSNACPLCERTFSDDAITRHMPICQKLHDKKREAFDVAAKRQAAGAEALVGRQSEKRESTLKTDWRDKSSALKQAIEEQKRARAAGAQFDVEVVVKAPNMFQMMDECETPSEARSPLRQQEAHLADRPQTAREKPTSRAQSPPRATPEAKAQASSPRAQRSATPERRQQEGAQKRSATPERKQQDVSDRSASSAGPKAKQAAQLAAPPKSKAPPAASNGSDTRSPPKAKAGGSKSKSPAPRPGGRLQPKAIPMDPCQYCGRTFADDALERHTPICKKIHDKKREVFDVAKVRQADGANKVAHDHEHDEKAKPDWREKSNAFRQMIDKSGPKKADPFDFEVLM